MSHPQTIQDVVAQTLAERGIAEPTCWTRRPFFQQGRSLAHEMRFVGGRALWLADRNVGEGYDAEGTLLKAVALDVDEKRAAVGLWSVGCCQDYLGMMASSGWATRPRPNMAAELTDPFLWPASRG